MKFAMILGTILFFSQGDGGDKVVKYQLPSGTIKDFENLLDYILKVHKRFDLKSASKITKLKEADLKELLIEVIRSYPEKNLNYKYVHSVFSERVTNWLFEGEDRNRNFFWSVTPFYSTQFFLESMKLPDKLKRWNNLYNKILENLNNDLNKIVYANLKWPAQFHEN